MDGHLVLGHVDCRGEIISIEKEGSAHVLKIRPSDKKLMKFLVYKGSVAVEGISLTVVSVLPAAFLVKILPYTTERTNLKYKRKKDIVNIEFDILAKYANRK